MSLAEMKRLYLEDLWSCARIATAAHRSESSIRRILRGAGVELRPAGGSELQLSQAEMRRSIELYRTVGARAAAAELGLAHPQTVRARLRSIGEPLTQAGRRPARPTPAGYESVANHAARNGVTGSCIRQRIRAGQIPGAVLDESGSHPRWLIPVPDAEEAPAMTTTTVPGSGRNQNDQEGR